MRAEFDASQKAKRDARIIVILGNPPYDRFTGAAQAEEAELVAHYKGIELVEERTRTTPSSGMNLAAPRRSSVAIAFSTRNLASANSFSPPSTFASPGPPKNI